MKIQLLSDLHLEIHPRLTVPPAPGADLLVLAGDIGSYQRGSMLDAPDYGLTRFSPRHGWPTPVVFIPGNHEYDHADFDAVHTRLRELCDALGIVWLERESILLDGVRLVGTTLWADFDALSEPGEALTSVLRKRGKAMRAADFYLAKAATERAGQPFMADALREHSLACQAWLEKALRTAHDGPTVVITHFAPTLASADPRYGLSPGTAGFCNSLDHLLPHADLWLHGHLHCHFDYVKDGCRVVANPLGYLAKGEQEGFLPDKLIDTDHRRQGRA
ncbi:MAG: metallophosphoesterase [Gammaproteobacteria bacterium]|nr:metallophosphoesterase [Gammaproteobacteria bacterium]MBU1440704.1 metallophosphoesterase [Gammaproteobacteria bacterium]MBU2286027.1 metallophosphoesterase [Gammaproteobacteria bacterium]MBU2408652.1 metallophosphoesterase [Gammaproteobacteria bacterium]